MKILTGAITIPIERDGMKVGNISFNPSDVAFVEKLYTLLGKLEDKQKEYAEREDKIDAETSEDGSKISANIGEKIALYKESCEYIRTEIDELFGEYTSDTVFGNTNNFDVFEQFLSGVLPYIQEERDKKVSKYLNREQKRAAGLK